MAVRAAIAETKMRLNSASDGMIHIVHGGKKHDSVQYYLRADSSDKSGKYLKRGNENLIKELIQKEYDKKALQILEKEEKLLRKMNRHYCENDISNICDSMVKEKSAWVTTLCDKTDEWVSKWEKCEYNKKPFLEDGTIFYTKNGERVRSKSEVIIANLLADYNVPYKYECPLVDQNGIWVYPDFTVLNVKKRKEYYWEHMGMLEEAAYAQNAIKKIAKYEKHGLYQGENLIMSYESVSNPIDTKQIEELIKHFLL